MIRTAGIIARTDREEAIKLAAKLTDRLECEGFRVFLEPYLAKCLKRMSCSVKLEAMKTNIILTLGGDGTILRTCLRIPKPEPPILAIDMGVRGFLTEVAPERAFEAIDKYLKGLYFIEQYSKLASYIGEIKLPDALNEVFITSRYLAKLLHVRIWKGSKVVTDCRADGMIVASQVGSTGYAFSAGGPIIDPDIDAFVLTPVCPITFLHPIVFSTDAQVTIELLKPKSASVVVDGDFQMKIDKKAPLISIKKSEHESSFIRFKDRFYHRLKARLLFSREEGYGNE